MAELSPNQERLRDGIEGLIALAEPALDLLLAVGDRASRMVGGGDDDEPLAVRPPGSGASAGTLHRG